MLFLVTLLTVVCLASCQTSHVWSNTWGPSQNILKHDYRVDHQYSGTLAGPEMKSTWTTPVQDPQLYRINNPTWDMVQPRSWQDEKIVPMSWNSQFNSARWPMDGFVYNSQPVSHQWNTPTANIAQYSSEGPSSPWSVTARSWSGVPNTFATGKSDVWNRQRSAGGVRPVTYGGQRGWFVPEYQNQVPFYHHHPGHQYDDVQTSAVVETQLHKEIKPNPAVAVVPKAPSTNVKSDVIDNQSGAFHYNIPQHGGMFYSQQPWNQWQVSPFTNGVVGQKTFDPNVAYPDPATII